MKRKIINYFYNNEEEHESNKLNELLVLATIVVTIICTLVRVIQM